MNASFNPASRTAPLGGIASAAPPKPFEIDSILQAASKRDIVTPLQLTSITTQKTKSPEGNATLAKVANSNNPNLTSLSCCRGISNGTAVVPRADLEVTKATMKQVIINLNKAESPQALKQAISAAKTVLGKIELANGNQISIEQKNECIGALVLCQKKVMQQHQAQQAKVVDTIVKSASSQGLFGKLGLTSSAKLESLKASISSEMNALNKGGVEAHSFEIKGRMYVVSKQSADSTGAVEVFKRKEKHFAEGCFGRVYNVKNLTSPGSSNVVMKVAKKDVKGAVADIKNENTLLREIHKDEHKVGVQPAPFVNLEGMYITKKFEMDGDSFANSVATGLISKRPDEKQEMIAQAKSGLAVIHKNNKYHGDLKPANLGIIDGKPVIADLGGSRDFSKLVPLYKYPSSKEILGTQTSDVTIRPQIQKILDDNLPGYKAADDKDAFLKKMIEKEIKPLLKPDNKYALGVNYPSTGDILGSHSPFFLSDPISDRVFDILLENEVEYKAAEDKKAFVEDMIEKKIVPLLKLNDEYALGVTLFTMLTGQLPPISENGISSNTEMKDTDTEAVRSALKNSGLDPDSVKEIVTLMSVESKLTAA